MSGTRQTRMRNIVSRYSPIVSATVSKTLSHRGRPNHKNKLANRKEETVARVQADMSKPLGAMVMVAPMAKMVVMDMERRILIALAGERKLPPRRSANTATAAARASTAAQSIQKPAAPLLYCICFKPAPPSLAAPPAGTGPPRPRRSA